MQNKFVKLLRESGSLLIFVGLMMVFRSAVADWMHVPSGSMNPTVLEGDRILVNKHAYGIRVPFTTLRLTEGSAPQRGDIVVFDSPENGTTLLKRVVGIPGDMVEMREEELVINGTKAAYAPLAPANADQLLAETRAARPQFFTESVVDGEHAVMVLPTRLALRSFGPVRVPEGQYLMLGDNRDNSRDSRYIGFVPRAAIVGKAIGVAFSLDPEHAYLPRAGRFWAELR